MIAADTYKYLIMANSERGKQRRDFTFPYTDTKEIL
jgi:hypothetical protein